MPRYSDFVDRVMLQPELLARLWPSEPLDFSLLDRFRKADDAALTDGVAIVNPGAWPLVRGALLYALDALEPAHKIFQDEGSDLGSYWHGMMHRREADFDNARYWFRRAGRIAVFDRMHRAAAEHSAVLARQSSWDPYLFTGECEQARFGAVETTAELARVQRAEWEVLFDYCWRQAMSEGER